MTKEFLHQTLVDFIHNHKQYRGYMLHSSIVEKVFNKGLGAAPLFRFVLQSKQIRINENLFNRFDKANLEKLLNEVDEFKSWEILNVDYNIWGGESL